MKKFLSPVTDTSVTDISVSGMPQVRAGAKGEAQIMRFAGKIATALGAGRGKCTLAGGIGNARWGLLLFQGKPKIEAAERRRGQGSSGTEGRPATSVLGDPVIYLMISDGYDGHILTHGESTGKCTF